MDFNQQPNYQSQQSFNFSPRVPERNIALCVILSIITCGIYLYYWLYCLNEDLRTLTGNRNGTSGGVVIFLTLITCGIYHYYWLYKQGDTIDTIKVRMGRPNGSLGILYFILAFFGLGIVSYALMQNEINTLIKRTY